MAAQPLLNGQVKVGGVFLDPPPEGGATNPWSAPGYTRRPSKCERRDPIGGEIGGSGTTPTPAQDGRVYPPMRVPL